MIVEDELKLDEANRLFNKTGIKFTTEHLLKKYNRIIMNIEHGTFAPLVFSLNGGIGNERLMFHKHVAEKIATKTEESYEEIISFIRCKLTFLIIRSCLLCIRG